jgi:short-subunit dehydrogenase
MIARRGGHLVFISSLQGKAATPAAPLYLATKFGLRGFALGMREDLRGHGVGVSTVFPGFIRDAGMFANSGVSLPPGVGTRSPQDVANAVLRAIDEDRAEVDVAPLGLRVGAAVAGLAPSLAAGVSRRLGSHEIASAVSETQRDQR